MKIAFVTTGLEPGRDGVGDYTRGLARECARLGHTVTLLALADREIRTEIREARESVTLLRLPADTAWADRLQQARRWLEEFAPDWVSWQFVCYGYHPRGFMDSVAPSLVTLFAGFSVHVMMHELWLGDEIGASLRHRLVGFRQRRAIVQLLRKVGVRKVHTSNAAYAFRLKRHGIDAGLLPLFGSLPLLAAPPKTRDDSEWKIVLFGILHPNWPPEPFLSILARSPRRIHFQHIGAIRTGRALWDSLATEWEKRFTFERLGEKPAEEVAACLARADFGLATTPWILREKSSTVAAMVESGLPVLVNHNGLRYRGYSEAYSDTATFLTVDEALLERLSAARRSQPGSRLSAVTAQFLGALTCDEVVVRAS